MCSPLLSISKSSASRLAYFFQLNDQVIDLQQMIMDKEAVIECKIREGRDAAEVNNVDSIDTFEGYTDFVFISSR